LQSAA